MLGPNTRIPTIDVIRAVHAMLTTTPAGGPKIYKKYRKDYPSEEGWWLPNDFTRRPRITRDTYRLRTRLKAWGIIEEKEIKHRKAKEGVKVVRLLPPDSKEFQDFLRVLDVSVGLEYYDRVMPKVAKEIAKHKYVDNIFAEAKTKGKSYKSDWVLPLALQMTKYYQLRSEAEKLDEGLGGSLSYIYELDKKQNGGDGHSTK